MARISTTFSTVKKRPKFSVKVPAEDTMDILVADARKIYADSEAASVANMIRSVVSVVKDVEILATPDQLYTGSTHFHVPLLAGTVLDLYKHTMEVHGAPITATIEDDAFFLEYYTNIRLLNGEFTPMSVKLMGMKPFQYGAMEFDMKEEPDEYMIDFVHNILRLGLVTEEEIEYFLNMPPQTQNNVEGYLLSEDKVRILLESGQHIVFTQESIASTVKLLDSVNAFVLKLFPL